MIFLSFGVTLTRAFFKMIQSNLIQFGPWGTHQFLSLSNKGTQLKLFTLYSWSPASWLEDPPHFPHGKDTWPTGHSKNNSQHRPLQLQWILCLLFYSLEGSRLMLAEDVKILSPFCIDSLAPSEECNLPGSSDGKESACSSRHPGSIPESGKSPWERNSNPLQYSYLENLMNRGAWQATVYGVAKSQTRLSD